MYYSNIKTLEHQVEGIKWIKRGSEYITYHPFIEDLKNRRVYVTKRDIKAIPDFLDAFPKDMLIYEMWYAQLKNCDSFENRNGGLIFTTSVSNVGITV